MANFYLICGMSGSGKSTFAAELRQSNPTLKFFDVDSYYAAINGNACIRANAFDVWHTLYKDLHECETNNEDIVVITNALTKEHRQELINWFPFFTHHLIWFAAPFALCCENNNKRTRKIPMEIMEQHWRKIEMPHYAEDWTTIIYLINYNNKGLTPLYIKGNIKNYISFQEFI